MAGKRAEVLLATMLFIRRFTLERAWTALTDGEFYWEPVPGSWSVRRRADCRTTMPFGSGDRVVDFGPDVGSAAAGPVVEPMTTIAWLMWHIGSMPGRTAELDFLGGDHSPESGWTSPYLAEHPIFTSAGEAVAALQAGWSALEQVLHSSTDQQLEQGTRFWGYPGHPGPPAAGYHIVASVLNEVSHHGTQICMLRDLYEAAGGRPPGPHGTGDSVGRR